MCPRKTNGKRVTYMAGGGAALIYLFRELPDKVLSVCSDHNHDAIVSLEFVFCWSRKVAEGDFDFILAVRLLTQWLDFFQSRAQK